MTIPTVNDVAKELLESCDEVHKHFSGIAIPGESSFCINSETWKIRRVCTRLLELEKEHAIWEKSSLCRMVKDNDSLRANLALFRDLCGKLEACLKWYAEAKFVGDDSPNPEHRIGFLARDTLAANKRIGDDRYSHLTKEQK